MRWIGLVLFSLLAGACSVGKDSLLFVTRTNVAIDLDSEPPTVDIGYKRDELVLAPVDEDGKVLPVMTTVGVSAKPLRFGANHSFATGEAALLMSRYLLENVGPEFPDSIDSNHPTAGMDGTISAKGSKRYYFGTNTVLGLGVQWNAEYVPTAVALGYKRKELAFVPLAEKDGRRSVASLIATAHTGSEVEDARGTGAVLGQTFATGLAATYLAMHPAVRRAIGPSVVPNYEKARLALEEIETADAKAARQADQRAEERRIIRELRTRYDAASDPQKLAIQQQASELASLEVAAPEAAPLSTNDFTKMLSKNASGTKPAVLIDLNTLNAFRP
ncbi:MAG TPA: hypothetical protein VF530_14050 [Planctomycetota bacterium]